MSTENLTHRFGGILCITKGAALSPFRPQSIKQVVFYSKTSLGPHSLYHMSEHWMHAAERTLEGQYVAIFNKNSREKRKIQKILATKVEKLTSSGLLDLPQNKTKQSCLNK